MGKKYVYHTAMKTEMRIKDKRGNNTLLQIMASLQHKDNVKKTNMLEKQKQNKDPLNQWKL